ncbi:glycosyltransferase [Paeniroseomonas aquatica]|uniref:Glycosyltransferase n=1 Tax=Paeniroseomonas aquatica TaxID=373043 RepID=A0ABT8A833_9PROT|nr:glycosyltransferase [Paeniroseomonas aquatica]MDN3565974.1 glycosyltransferase [Paeniroseomonas aquatica]
MRPVGYYLHHQGIGHWQRATALARRLRRPCVLLGTIPADQRARAPCPVLDLPDDAVRDPARHGDLAGVPGLHYAPLGHEGTRRRAAAIAGWIAARRPALLVVDVSVEVALLSRLCATPFLYVRLNGRREDPPHLAAFRAAEALIAPFPAPLESSGTPAWVLRKSVHTGFLAVPAPPATEGGGIVVVFGRGGGGGDGAALAAAARATPDHAWRVLGPVVPADAAPPVNLALLGWRADAQAILAGADLVIGGAGDGLVAEVAALGKRFLCLPEPRPFGEQAEKAARLAGLGAAVVRPAWPAAAAWPALLREAAALDPGRIAALHDPDALDRAAVFIDAAADRAEAYGP